LGLKLSDRERKRRQKITLAKSQAKQREKKRLIRERKAEAIRRAGGTDFF